MNKWVLAGLIMIGATIAHAYTETVDVINSSCTHTEVTVPATVAMWLDNWSNVGQSTAPYRVMNGRQVIRIQGLAGMNYRVDFTSTNISSSYGTLLTSSGTLTYSMADRDPNGNKLSLWAIVDGDVNTGKIAIDQCKSK